MPGSFMDYANLPSAIVSDGALLTIPIWSVTTMVLTESFHLPPIGSSGARSVLGTHDDRIALTGVLVGPERHAWKLALETLAETGRRGSAMSAYSGGAMSGLVLVTAMTIRTDMQVESLSFTASAAKRDLLDVSISMIHMPRPSALGKLLDVASVGVGALADAFGD
jgi:phage protein U